MKQIDVAVERVVYSSQRPFEQVLAALNAGIGQPPFQEFIQRCYEATDAADVEAVCAKAAGPYGILQFFRLDMGRVLEKYPHTYEPKSVRIVAGNPAIMASMAVHVPDAASYAPVTILVDQRSTGVYVSYDRMESLLKPYGSNPALQIARDLDSKVEALISSAIR